MSSQTCVKCGGTMERRKSREGVEFLQCLDNNNHWEPVPVEPVQPNVVACRRCGLSYDANETGYRCANCGELNKETAGIKGRIEE